MIYVASSWRNPLQSQVVAALRRPLPGHPNGSRGLKVYDFRNPGPGDHGFHWSEIDRGWHQWTPEQYIAALDHPLALAGFEKDMSALRDCTTCILVLPCGRSAHLELGWACGAGKHTAILIDSGEPELMNKMVDFITPDLDAMVQWAWKVETF